ncbi:DWNN-domain-containing protein [Ramaria rubella]|nr:DWNN-domain-containing protein [Ramaria rubella]
MASSVFYKFKSQRDESRVSFDGTGISVFDLKKEIILANNLKAPDFDLHIYDPNTEQEYANDSHIIPRASSVIAKRLPAARPGKGKAAMYIAGVNAAASSSNGEQLSQTGKQHASGSSTWNRHTGPMSKRFDRNEPAKEDQFVSKAQGMVPQAAAGHEDEADALKAMFQATEDHWKETNAKMSTFRKVDAPRFPGSLRNKPQHQHSFHPYQQPQRTSDRPLPASYVCYRCGQKGHWIQDCPTNNDREWDHKPRIKRTTGIPRSFLKTVEQPTDGNLAQGVMVTPEGGYVIAQPDTASWQKQRNRPKTLTAEDIRERQPPSDPSIVCSLCQKLFREAVFCEECVQTFLLERDFLCPGCGSKIPSLDKLVMDKPTRTRVNDYIDKEIKEYQKNEEKAENATSRTSTPVPTVSQDPPLAEPSVAQEQEYSEQQPGNEAILAQQPQFPDIPQLQAQIAQLTVMLQNPILPPNVRQTTQMQLQQLQAQVQQAQMVMAVAASMSNANPGIMGMPQYQEESYGGGYNPTMVPNYKRGEYRPTWTNPFPNQQPAGIESAYQRLPVNNRRRNMHRDRPSDFYEVPSGQSNIASYWE